MGRGVKTLSDHPGVSHTLQLQSIFITLCVEFSKISFFGVSNPAEMKGNIQAAVLNNPPMVPHCSLSLENLGNSHHPKSKPNLCKDFAALQSWQRFPVKLGSNFCKLKWREAHKNLCLVLEFSQPSFCGTSQFQCSGLSLFDLFRLQLSVSVPKWLLHTFSHFTCLK